jgi:hypothetical protein
MKLAKIPITDSIFVASNNHVFGKQVIGYKNSGLAL